MTATYPAKTRRRPGAMIALVAATLAGSLLTGNVMADFDGLNQRLRTEQQQSRFQLMLEQVQASARRRAAQRPVEPAVSRAASTPVDLGDWAESVRLEVAPVTGSPPRDVDAAAARRFEAHKARERDQRRILDQQQQRQALVAGPRARSSPGDLGGYATKRRELVRFGTQNQRLSLQRKLRR